MRRKILLGAAAAALCGLLSGCFQPREEITRQDLMSPPAGAVEASSDEGSEEIEETEAEETENPGPVSGERKETEGPDSHLEEMGEAGEMEKTEETAPLPSEGKAEEMKEKAASGTAPWLGSWEVKDYQSAKVSSLSKEEIEEYLNSGVAYYLDALSVNGVMEELPEDGYEFTDYTEEELVQDFKANLGEWWNGIGDVVLVTAPSQLGSFGSQFFAADDETIWIYYEGVFFLAKKAGA